MARPNMEEIARLAGVSVATVSRTLHSPQHVRPATRARVVKIIEKYHYVYNAAAADLSRQKTNAIGLLIPTTHSPVFGATLLSIQERCQERGYAVFLGNTQYDSGTEQRLLQQFLERRVAGLILTGFTFPSEKLIRDLVEAKVPVVVIWEKVNDPRINYVGFDNFQTGEWMTKHLIQAGHSRIGLIIGPFGKVGRVRERWWGYQKALKKNKLPFDPVLVVETEPTLENGRMAMDRLLGLADPPTAVFAASDILALGAVKAAKDRGLTVPGDVSVVGHDDIVFAAYADPPLTTIRVDSAEIGRLAVEVLLDQIEDPGLPVRQHCLEALLVRRLSCAPPGPGKIKKRRGVGNALKGC